MSLGSGVGRRTDGIPALLSLNHRPLSGWGDCRPLTDTCSCCRRPWDICFSSPRHGTPREFVCDDCKPHQGSTFRSDPEHIELYKALLSAEEREHGNEVTRLNGRIADLERELQERPEKLVERWHGADEIQAATDEQQRAFRSRQNAWQALCEIRLLHREASDGKCRCGKRFKDCPEAQIVGYYPGLARWEKQEWERYKKYEDHALPERHPALTDPRWRPD